MGHLAGGGDYGIAGPLYGQIIFVGPLLAAPGKTTTEDTEAAEEAWWHRHAVPKRHSGRAGRRPRLWRTARCGFFRFEGCLAENHPHPLL